MTPSSRAPVVLPFKFRLRRESVDWSRLNAVDVDLVVRQVDVDLLQEHISTVTFCSLEGECCLRCRNPVDPSLVKLLRLAQLSLEWLLHSQEGLTHHLRATEERLAAASREHHQLLGQLKKKEKKQKAFIRELKHRKEIIRSQQSQFAPQITSSEKCRHCEKSFLDSSCLQSHMQRRHPMEHCIQWGSDTENASVINSLKSENDSLKLELSIMKERIDQQRQAFEVKSIQGMEQQSQKDLLTERRVRAEMMAQMERKIEDTRDSMRREMEFLYNQNIQAMSVVNQNQDVRQEKPVSPVHLQSERDMDNYKEIETTQMLVQKMKKQEKQWESRLQEIKAVHKSEKNTLLNELSQMQMYLSENREMRLRLQEKKKVIRAQREQIKSIISNASISSPVPEELSEEEKAIQAQREQVEEPVIVSLPAPDELSEEEKVSEAQKELVEEPPIVSSPAPEELSEEEKDSSSMSEKRSAERKPELEQTVIIQLKSQRKEASQGLTDKTPLSSIEESDSEMEEEEPVEHLRGQSPQPSLNQSSSATKTESHEDLEIDPQQLQSLRDQNSNTENRNQGKEKKTNNVARKMQKMTQNFKQFWSRQRRSTKEEPGPAPACGKAPQSGLTDAGTGTL